MNFSLLWKQAGYTDKAETQGRRAGVHMYWSQHGPQRMNIMYKRTDMFSELPYFGIPSTILLQTSSLFVQLLMERG